MSKILCFREITKENLVKNYLKNIPRKFPRGYDILLSGKEVEEWLDNNVISQGKILEGMWQSISLESIKIKNTWRISITPELALEITLP